MPPPLIIRFSVIPEYNEDLIFLNATFFLTANEKSCVSTRNRSRSAETPSFPTSGAVKLRAKTFSWLPKLPAKDTIELLPKLKPVTVRC